MNQREAVYPHDPHSLYEQHGYSPAIRCGDFLFVSGQVGATKDGLPEPDLEKQTQLAFDNLTDVLSAAGCSLDDVVDVTLFVVDPEQNLGTVFPVVRRNLTTRPYPALTGVGVPWLSGFQFEIKVVARLAK